LGRVEFQMLLLIDFLNEAPIEALFAETTGKPFGEKIKSFKNWCDFGVPGAQKPALQAIYKDLDELLPKRNFLVHGETREGTFKGTPRQPYRVGLVKNNLDISTSSTEANMARTYLMSAKCKPCLSSAAKFSMQSPVSEQESRGAMSPIRKGLINLLSGHQARHVKTKGML
jgi:hypothetical protein